MIDLVLHNRTASRSLGPAFFRRVCTAALPYLKVPHGRTAEVSIVLVGTARMRTMNRRYRRKDKSTDVLSFPLPTRPIKGYTAISLGDLFISPADVARKAVQAGRPVRAQMAWTVVHGLLHLAGYDHERSAREARNMAALEKKILRKFDIRH